MIECASAAGWTDIANADSRWSHEFRVSGDLGRVSVIGGVFFQDAVVEHVGDFHYGDPAWNALDPARVIQGKANNPDVRAPTVQFTNDITRSTEEVAVFGEVAWHVTDALTVAVGARGYDLEVGFEGFSAFRYGGRPVPNLAAEPGVTVRPSAVGGRDYAANLGDFQPLTASDVIGKVTVSWQWSDSVLLYATSSQGYRPPGFNRAAAAGVATAQGVAARANDGPGGFPDYFIPVTYRSDEVFNVEFGWKALLADGRLRLNGNLYRMDWNDIQVSHFDSQNISIFTIVDNAGDACITGLEMDMEWRPTENFTLHASASWNDTELVRVNPTFDFVVADVGSALPLTPEYQTIVRARYEWDFWRRPRVLAACRQPRRAQFQLAGGRAGHGSATRTGSLLPGGRRGGLSRRDGAARPRELRLVRLGRGTVRAQRHGRAGAAACEPAGFPRAHHHQSAVHLRRAHLLRRPIDGAASCRRRCVLRRPQMPKS